MQPRVYQTFNYPNAAPGSKTLLTGIRQVKCSSCPSRLSRQPKVYISGFYEVGNQTITFVYKGDLNGKGKWYPLNFPSSPGSTVKSTNLYGPNNGEGKNIQVVGNYSTLEQSGQTFGCLYQGPLDGSGSWTKLVPPFGSSSNPVINTIAHSTNGGLVVGNYDTRLIQGKAFIYNIATQQYIDLAIPNAKSQTAYGIWQNFKHCYTICGSYSPFGSGLSNLSIAYLVDWDDKTKHFSNLRSYYYQNDPNNIITHFDGISGGSTGYYLTGDAVDAKSLPHAFFAKVDWNGSATWSEVAFPGSPLTSGNSVLKNVVIGVYDASQLSGNQGQINGYLSG